MRIHNYFLFATILIILLSGIANASVGSEFNDGLNLISKKKYERALKVFQGIVSHFERSGDIENQRYVIARYYRAKCNLNLSNLEDALNDFLFVDKADLPTHPAWQDIVNIYILMKEDKLAISYLEEKIKKSRQFDYYFELGRLYWRINDRENAINVFEEADSIDSSFNQLLFYMSYLYWEMGDYRDAGRTAQRLEKISFDNVFNQYARGLVYHSMGLYEKGADEFRLILNANPEDITMRTLLLDCLIKSADFDNADSLLRELIENNREDAWFWFKACEIPLIKRDAAEAEVIYNSLDIELKKQTQPVCLKAFSLVMKSENEEAETMLAQARERDAEKTDYYPILAALKQHLSKPDDLADLLLRFGENIDGDFPVDEALFWYLTFKGPDALQSELTDFAAQLGSDNPEISSCLALSDFAILTGDLEKALMWVDLLIRHEEDNPEHPYLAAILSLRLGNTVKAKEYWDMFLAIPVKIDDWGYIETEIRLLLGE
ncbi:tetratricopeptide repeat protein [bacterium]|nr:tetratricopeptide repeat protein [bacterium]